MYSLAAHNPGKDLDDVLKVSFKEPYVVYNPADVGECNEETMEHLKQLVINIVTGLPALKELPAKCKRLMSQGLNIKDSYKEIISGSSLGLLAKGQAIAAVGMNIFQMTKLAKQIKHNVKDMTKDLNALKMFKAQLNDDETLEIGQKCADEGLLTPLECFEAHGEPPEADDSSDDDDIMNLLGNASNMFRNQGGDPTKDDDNPRPKMSGGKGKPKLTPEERKERAKKLRDGGDPAPSPADPSPADPSPGGLGGGGIAVPGIGGGGGPDPKPAPAKKEEKSESEEEKSEEPSDAEESDGEPENGGKKAKAGEGEGDVMYQGEEEG